MHAELLDDLGAAGYRVEWGALGENLTTRGLDVLALPVGAPLTLGDAVVVVTGLRNPCRQIEDRWPGLLARLVRRGDDGRVERLAGVMGIVARGGVVRPGQAVDVELPAGPHHKLTRV